MSSGCGSVSVPTRYVSSNHGSCIQRPRSADCMLGSRGSFVLFRQRIDLHTLRAVSLPYVSASNQWKLGSFNELRAGSFTSVIDHVIDRGTEAFPNPSKTVASLSSAVCTPRSPFHTLVTPQSVPDRPYRWTLSSKHPFIAFCAPIAVGLRFPPPSMEHLTENGGYVPNRRCD